MDGLEDDILLVKRAKKLKLDALERLGNLLDMDTRSMTKEEKADHFKRIEMYERYVDRLRDTQQQETNAGRHRLLLYHVAYQLLVCLRAPRQIAEKPQLADRPSRDFHLKSVLELQALARFSWVTVHGSKFTCVCNLCLWFVSCLQPPHPLRCKVRMVPSWRVGMPSV